MPWMAKYERKRFPDRVVWKQDNVTHSRFYWLALPEDQINLRQLVAAKRDGQSFTIEKVEDVGKVTLLLNDDMADLDAPIKVLGPGGEVLFEGKVARSADVVERTLEERGDRRMVFSAEVTVDLP